MKRRPAVLSAAISFILLALPASSAQPPAALTLEECYRRALASAETLTVSDQEVLRAEARYRSLRAGVLPRASFVATELYQDTTGVANPSTGGGSFTAHHRPEHKFTVSQPLFSGFREFAGLKAAGDLKEARRLDRDRAAQLLYQDVAEAFYNAVEWDQRAVLLAGLRQAAGDRLKELRERVRVGRSRRSELLAANSQAASIESQVRNAEGFRRQSLELLSFVTGGPVAAVRDETPDPAAPGDVEPLLKAAAGRPDLLSRAAESRAASHALTAARRGLWPSLGVSGDYYTKRVSSNRPIDWGVTFTLDAPIYSGGEWRASVDEASAGDRALKAEAARAARAAGSDVRALHAQLASAVAETESRAEAARLAEESYRAQEKEFRLGLVTNLEVLSALSAWEQTRLDYDGKRLEAKLLDVRLRVAAGSVR